MSYSSAEPSKPRASTIAIGRIVTYGVTAVNLWFLVLVANTALHAKAGTLQAQEDFGLFTLVVAVSGPLAIVSLITLVVGGLLGLRALKFDASLLRNSVFVLGTANCLAPFALAFLLRWLVHA